MGSKSRFAGVGVRTYEAPGVEDLEYAVTDVESVRGLLGAAFEGEPACDPTEDAARAYLNALAESMPEGGSLLVLWSGHGLKSPARGVKLLCTDSPANVARGLEVGALVEPCASAGADQVLLIIDTCFSGAAISDATQLAASLMEAYPPQAERVWFGVLTSCSGFDTAVDGRLGALLRRLLTPELGPSDPHVRRRWSVHNARLRGDDLCDAVLKEWDGEDYAPAVSQYR